MTDRKDDNIENPAHYTVGGIECIKFARQFDYITGCVIKYVTRAPYKGNELEDLKKAGQYLKFAKVAPKIWEKDEEGGEDVVSAHDYIEAWNMPFFAGAVILHTIYGDIDQAQSALARLITRAEQAAALLSEPAPAERDALAVLSNAFRCRCGEIPEVRVGPTTGRWYVRCPPCGRHTGFHVGPVGREEAIQEWNAHHARRQGSAHEEIEQAI